MRLRYFGKELVVMALLTFVILTETASSFDSEIPSRLWNVAEKSLESNIIIVPSGSYLAAGQNQFKTLWTRDFCFASRGLFLLGRFDVVRNHLEKLLEARRQDGLVPRVMDSVAPRWRVSRQVLRRVLPFFRSDLPLADPLRPEYRDEHGTEAIDSNLLVLLTALEYLDRTGDRQWWDDHEPELHQVYKFYDDKKTDDGLIEQRQAFSDWQDSVSRIGRTSYTNLLFYTVSRRLAGFPRFGIAAGEIESLKTAIEKEFIESKSGLFRSIAGYDFISLDSNLLAIDWGFYDRESAQAQALYANLKSHAIWGGLDRVPGFVTVPRYPSSWKSTAVKVVKLSHYHDRLYWSWLMALASKTAYLQGDHPEALRISRELAKMVRRDGWVGEVFFPDPEYTAWRSWLFRSERPFSWGAAFVLDLASTLSRSPRQ